MVKALFDADALVAQFESATVKQGEQLRRAVSTATLQALKGRELTLKNIRATLKAVTGAAGTGLAKNAVAGIDAEGLLEKAVSGMDDALLQAVEAHRVALGQLVAQGADLREKQLKKALEEIDKFEDSLIGAVKQASEAAQSQLGSSWGQVLERMQAGGTLSGARAGATAEQLMADMHGAMRSSRAASIRAAQALAESYTAMVSGVLIGMSDALKQGAAAPEAKAAAAPRKKG